MDKTLDEFKNLKQDEKAVDRSKKLKVAIVGTGWIAKSHIQRYLQMDDVEIVAGCDLIEGKAEKLYKEFGIEGARFYTSDLEMYKNEQLDAVSVCTYNATHAECAINALNAGVNVLLEKPMCVTTEEAIEIMRAEKKSGKESCSVRCSR